MRGADCRARPLTLTLSPADGGEGTGRALTLIWLFIGALLLNPVASAADEIVPSYAMFRDPEIIVPDRIYYLDSEVLPLWRLALARPEAEYQRLAAESIARAHRMKFPGLEAAKPDLLRLATAQESGEAVRLAAAHALIALDARESAADLFQVAQRGGADLRYLIEPALAAWDYPPIREVWRSRLTDQNARRRDLLLAADGAALVRDPQALSDLAAIATAWERPSDIRLAAARARGRHCKVWIGSPGRDAGLQTGG